MIDGDHERWMRMCLELAERGAGLVSPNPMVGSVIVGTDGTLLGQGWHREYGGPHAERHAVADAERRYGVDVLRHGTLYVNLEPCNHHGKTPPCVDVILEKAIPRVVLGTIDPFPDAAGNGLERLRSEGVDVTPGVLEGECRRFNEGFFHHQKTGRPLVTLKLAQTLDGRIAAASGKSQWISGEPARRLVHHWRATVDGILVGTGTARKDDPALTVRHVEGRQPIRVVLDRKGRLPADLQLFSDEYGVHTLAVTAEGANPAYADQLERAGGRIIQIGEETGGLDLSELLDRLGRDGGRDGLPMLSLMVEGGAALASSLLREDLVDRLFLFLAPRLLGDGLPALSGRGTETMEEALQFVEHSWEPVGTDMLFRGYRRDV